MLSVPALSKLVSLATMPIPAPFSTITPLGALTRFPARLSPAEPIPPWPTSRWHSARIRPYPSRVRPWQPSAHRSPYGRCHPRLILFCQALLLVLEAARLPVDKSAQSGRIGPNTVIRRAFLTCSLATLGPSGNRVQGRWSMRLELGGLRPDPAVARQRQHV